MHLWVIEKTPQTHLNNGIGKGTSDWIGSNISPFCGQSQTREGKKEKENSDRINTMSHHQGALTEGAVMLAIRGPQSRPDLENRKI
jgi:hypothetical protein